MLASSLIAMRARTPTVASTFPHAASTVIYGGMKTCDNGMPEVCHCRNGCAPFSANDRDIELGLEPTLAMTVFKIFDYI